MEDVDLLDDVTNIMERKDQELRMISVRLHPYSGIMSRGTERISNMIIEEVFIEELLKVDIQEMSERLNSADPQVRIRPAANMRCLISLVDHVTKRTRFRKELRMLRIARQVEEFYQNTSDMKEARHQAENFLNRRLRRMFRDMNADETAELKQRSNQMMDQIEMRVAGSIRRIPTKMMPDPDDPQVMVIDMRDPATQELLPAMRRGVKRVVERNRDGYRAEVR